MSSHFVFYAYSITSELSYTEDDRIFSIKKAPYSHSQTSSEVIQWEPQYI